MEKTFYKTEYLSPVGRLTLACDGENLVGLWLEGQKYFGDTLPCEAVQNDEHPVLFAAKQWLDSYFAGEKPDAAQLPLAPIGGVFRQQVWKILLDIPYGEVMTYGAIAKKLGTGCAQAVGGAVGHNPISIIIPCHRVVGAQGKLTGYAGGLDKKVFLLCHEGVDPEKLK